MQARILLLVGVLSLSGCSKPRISPEEVSGGPPVSPEKTAREISAHVPRHAPEGTVYLLRRIAVATEDTLWGFEAGLEARVIEEHSGKLLVEIEGVQFEISREDATNDLRQRDAVVAEVSEKEARRLAAMALRKQQAEDRQFLAEENARRRSFAEAKIAGLRSAIESARAEIAKLEAESNESAYTPTTISSSEADTNWSAEEDARQQRIAALRDYIANCDREILILSDIVSAEDQ